MNEVKYGWLIYFLKFSRPDNVGKALICILEHGKGGDCWVVEDGKSPRLAVIPNDDAY